MTFLKTFEERGFFKQTTHPEELKNRVESGRICAYIGFDPTADSLHVGHLIPLMGLAHLQRSGQRVIALMGGGTAMIGDPSGKTEMRKMLTEQQLEANVVKIRSSLKLFKKQKSVRSGKTPVPLESPKINLNDYKKTACSSLQHAF